MKTLIDITVEMVRNPEEFVHALNENFKELSGRTISTISKLNAIESKIDVMQIQLKELKSSLGNSSDELSQIKADIKAIMDFLKGLNGPPGEQK